MRLRNVNLRGDLVHCSPTLGCCPCSGGGFVLVDLLFNVFLLFGGVLWLTLLYFVLLCVHSSFAIILKRKRKRKLVALLLLSHGCVVAVDVLCLFLMVPWVGLQCVTVVFPDHTHQSKAFFVT